MKTSFIDIPLEGTELDTLRAAQYLRDANAGCIIVLGGDGTCRVASKGCGLVPLLPISTGTNNVVPYLIEGTAAGLAAAYVARQSDVAREQFCYRHKRLVVRVNGQEVDQALVDVALLSTRFTGSKAVWDASELRQVFVSRAQPFNIGISSVVGMVRPIGPSDPNGACVTISSDGHRVLAPIAPGAFAAVGIGTMEEMKPGVRYPVQDIRPAVLSLDGEREVTLSRDERAEVALELEGPWIVNVERTLMQAVESRTFEL
jgi:predicted polyphosphate/ATP-dependent NAD kinase